jgi:outer membrane protein OmpA-like peptidoglycan-associated protein
MSRSLLALLVVVVGLAPSIARAESGRFNVHVQAGAAGPPSALAGDLVVDWQLVQPVALELTIGGGAYLVTDELLLDQSVGIFTSSIGARFRFADDQSGYPEEGGSISGNFWLAPHVGVIVASGAALTLDVAVGYELSIAAPLSLGLFVRPTLAIGGAGVTGFVTGGITVSFEIDPLREAIDPDRDHDGVANTEDRCPRTPEGSEVDERGCVPMPTVLVLEGITFGFDSAQIEPGSQPTLERAAQMLADNPDVRVEIGGHTDDIGAPEHNDRLSRDRAQSVADWLIDNRIERSRLVVRGYGAASPRVPNTDEQSRSLNRRIEFRQLGAR